MFFELLIVSGFYSGLLAVIIKLDKKLNDRNNSCDNYINEESSEDEDEYQSIHDNISDSENDEIKENTSCEDLVSIINNLTKPIKSVITKTQPDIDLKNGDPEDSSKDILSLMDDSKLMENLINGFTKTFGSKISEIKAQKEVREDFPYKNCYKFIYDLHDGKLSKVKAEQLATDLFDFFHNRDDEKFDLNDYLQIPSIIKYGVANMSKIVERLSDEHLGNAMFAFQADFSALRVNKNSQ